ncbi:MAG: hypothetical protein WAW17_32340 [Rhodococcus sp. (in: high G+C Gram-positive bacteria)]|uniref:hypothetical protein n=1 Tax=Rhodococcus sp. TaxID=1831 RepID=UPI003BB06B68
MISSSKSRNPKPQELIADGVAGPMTMGARTMREWVRILPGPNHDNRTWRQALQRSWAVISEK